MNKNTVLAVNGRLLVLIVIVVSSCKRDAVDQRSMMASQKNAQLDLRCDRTKAHGLSGFELQMVLMAPMWDEVKRRGGDVEEFDDVMRMLTHGQRAMVTISMLEAEVNNGGFDQYFFNSSGDYAHEAYDALLLIGSHEIANLLDQAIKQFPGGRVPKNRETRNEQLEALGEPGHEKLRRLDLAFFSPTESISKLLDLYVTRHPDEFFTP